MADQNSTKHPQRFTGAFDIVAMAASAGGLNAIITILSGLPASFPACILVVQHLDPHYKSLLPEILARRTRLKVAAAQEGSVVEAGTVLVAPPNKHLLVNPEGTLSLSGSELVHFVRPSADLLFESAAAAYRDRVIGVVLSGTGSDGNMGVQAIKNMGGTVIAQDPSDSEFAGMPEAAIATNSVDRVLPLDDISKILMELVEKGIA